MIYPKSMLTVIGISFFFSACSSTVPKIAPKPVAVKTIQEVNTTKHFTAVPPPPKKKIELKAVQDDNFSPEYMYPEDTYKKDRLAEKKKEAAADNLLEEKTPPMSKEECIGMIGEEKFNQYTKMFGNEAASLKRCTLLKSMQKS